MRLFVVTGHKIDFTNRLYRLYEPEVFRSCEKAYTSIMETLDDEKELLDDGDDVECTETSVGSPMTADCDYELNTHEGYLVELKLREIKI